MTFKTFVCVAISVCALADHAASAQTFVRQGVSALTPLQVTAYRLGVSETKKRPPTDPTSWIYVNPATGPWLTKQFTFFDENGAEKQMTGAEIIDTVQHLNYRYDRLHTAPAALTQVAPVTTTEQTVGTSAPGAVELRTAPTTLVVPLARGDGQGALIKPPTAPSRYVLQFSEVDAGPGLITRST